MRRAREAILVTLVLVLASVPAVALPQPPAGPFQEHGPIVITADANFTAANGVRAGTGTPSDPYVISGWSFATAGVALRIEGVSAAWVVRDNAFTAGTGVSVKNTTSLGLIANNQVIVRGTGVHVANADPVIVDNSFIGDVGAGANGKGVDLATSNARVESNAFMYLQFGVRADRGSPSIICNDIHDDIVLAGISVKFTTNATIACNIITQCTLGIDVYAGIGTLVVNNSIDACYGGIHVDLTKDVTVANNTIRFSLGTQLKVTTVSGNVTGNLIVDGRADGVVVVRSPILFANNTVENHVSAGVRFEGTSGNLSGNLLVRNDVGIQLVAGSVVTLRANVMANNTVGLDIPYASRQAIANMSANVVNGLNVDGGLNASQRVLFYKAANVSIEGRVIDSGFSAGFYGAITAQGQVVLYEVDTAEIHATVISHGNVGVGVVNSFNVNVNDSLLVSNLVGVKAEVAASAGQVPNCVVSVKRTNVTIPVDPVATAGIVLTGCLGIVADVNVSIVDVGIRAEGSAGLFLRNSTVSSTRLALDVHGAPGMVVVKGSAFVDSRVGARFSNTIGVFTDNTVTGNAEAGVRLENGASIELARNNISFNGEGLVDVEVCGGPLTCSSVEAEANVFLGNEGDGARVRGASTWRADVALGNGGDGFELGSAKLRGVVSAGNEGDGARISGRFEVRASDFTRNEEDGLDIVGEGELRETNLTHNGRAGLRVVATYVTAIHLNASFNFDGIVASEGSPGPSGLPGLTPAGVVNGVWQGRAGATLGPLDVHRSVLVGNERDAIRAGYSLVNATHNWFGSSDGPRVNVADTVGAFQNGVSPMARFVPYYVDPAMTTTGPVFLL